VIKESFLDQLREEIFNRKPAGGSPRSSSSDCQSPPSREDMHRVGAQLVEMAAVLGSEKRVSIEISPIGAVLALKAIDEMVLGTPLVASEAIPVVTALTRSLQSFGLSLHLAERRRYWLGLMQKVGLVGCFMGIPGGSQSMKSYVEADGLGPAIT
jgi:hypothetical protein